MQIGEKYDYLLALKSGCKKSFQRVFEDTYPLIFHYCLKFIRQEALAEEATGDVFIRLWQKRAIIDPHQPIEALLYKIARDTAYNYLKKIASDERLKQVYFEQYPVIETKDGETILLAEERSATVKKIIEALPPRRQEIFKMHYYEGIDNQSIADQLHLSPHTVKAQLVKARHYLRQQLNLTVHESLFLLFLLLIG